MSSNPSTQFIQGNSDRFNEQTVSSPVEQTEGAPSEKAGQKKRKRGAKVFNSWACPLQLTRQLLGQKAGNNMECQDCGWIQEKSRDR